MTKLEERTEERAIELFKNYANWDWNDHRQFHNCILPGDRENHERLSRIFNTRIDTDEYIMENLEWQDNIFYEKLRKSRVTDILSKRSIRMDFVNGLDPISDLVSPAAKFGLGIREVYD
jgi:hypothetical protein